MTLLTNLEAYWKFDESSGNAADATGNGHTGTNTNTATFSTGKVNNGAYVAHASAQYFDVASSAGLNFTGDFSVSGWFYFTVTNQANMMASRGWDAAQAGHNWWFYYPGNNTISILISNGTVENVPTWAWTPSSATWYHIAMVYTASAGQVELFIDGTSQTAKTGFPTTINNTSKSTVIGNLLNNLGSDEGVSFGGRIDELGIWTRVLSSSEITQLYNGGSGLQYPFGTGSTISTQLMMGV